MIAVVECPEPLPALCERVLGLPDPPALRWSGFVVLCPDTPSVAAFAGWLFDVRQARPRVPARLVWHREAASAAVVAARAFNFRDGCEVPAGWKPDRPFLDGLIEDAVESAVLRDWLAKWPVLERARQHAWYALASHAVRGDSLSKVCAALEIDPSTLHRWMKDYGSPPPGVLWREGRVHSVEIRMAMGMPLTEARRAAGWMTDLAFRRARDRLRGRAT